MKKSKYALRYKWSTEYRAEGYTKEDAIDDDHGLCDAIVAFSIIRPEDGSYSQLLMSADGNTGKEVTDKDLFKLWMMLGMQLNNRGKLKGWHKQAVEAMADLIKKMMNHFQNDR